MRLPHVVSIIDDEAAVLRATGSLLRAIGFRVMGFASAEDFLDASVIPPAACIVCDVQMPGMSGVDLLIHLRSREIDTPFVFITAYPDDAVRQHVGADTCILRKPFDAEILASCIDQAIRDRGGTSA